MIRDHLIKPCKKGEANDTDCWRLEIKSKIGLSQVGYSAGFSAALVAAPVAHADTIATWSCSDTFSCQDASTFGETATIDFSGSGPLSSQTATLTAGSEGYQNTVPVPAGVVSGASSGGVVQFSEEFADSLVDNGNGLIEMVFAPGTPDGDFVLQGSYENRQRCFWR